MAEKDILVSIVCPIKDFTEGIERYFTDMRNILAQHFEQFELIIVQDGQSYDRHDELEKLIINFDGCRVIRLIRAYGVDAAITAGLDSAIGDIVVVCLPPFDPTDKLLEFVNIARRGVIGVGQRPSGKHEGVLRRFLKSFFYLVADRFFDIQLPANTTYFVSFPRIAVTQIQRARDKFRFLKVVTAQTGLPLQLVPYLPTEPDGRIYRSFVKSILLSIDVVTSQSLTLLRFASLLALILALSSAFYCTYALAIYMFKENVQEGWSSTSIFISGSLFILGLVQAIFTEYLGKLYFQTSKLPIYAIASESFSRNQVVNAFSDNVIVEPKVRE